MKAVRSLGNRMIALALSIIMVLGMFPVNAAFAADAGNYATVSTYTDGTVTGNGTANVEVLIENTTLQWVAGNDLRAEGWWVGIDVVAPEGYAENASYKVKTGPNVPFGDAKSFVANKDGEKDIQLWFAVSPESLAKFASEGRNLTMTYTFDWDGNGEYEQTVVFSVKPGRGIVLMKDAVQCYPEQGNVSTYTGGTVTGNKTANVVVMVDDVTLDWSDANDEIGRAQGWWVGIKVEAPTGMDAATVQAAQYQSKGNPNISWDDITEVKSFWDNKDSQDTDETHYIQLWFRVTPASLEKFKSENRNITMVYRFNWDGQGDYEQEITFSVDPTGNIVLNKKDQTGFGFAEETPDDIWIFNRTYQNVASGGQGDGAITYEIISGNAATIDAATGELTFTKAGTVMVQATKAADSEGYYNAVSAQYTITATKKMQTPQFTATNPGAITYAPVLTYENTVKNVLGGTVTYSIIDEYKNGYGVATIDSETGVLTILKAGTVKVQATITGDGYYWPVEVTYTLVINKADQTGFAFENAPAELTWQEAALDALTLINGKGNGAVTWKITRGTDVATVSADGKITLKKAGNFTIQAKKAGDDCYNASEAITATILVNRADQSGFGFGDTEKVTLTYNDNGNRYTLAATGGQSSKATVYTVISGDAAKVNKESGVVTLLKAGTVVIQATKPADDRYNEITDTYELTIKKAGQSFTFDHGREIKAGYGLGSFETKITASELNSGKVSYAISENTIGAAIDNKGVVTFANSANKVGKVTVTVTLEGDDRYEAIDDSYTIELNYEAAPAVPYDLQGDQSIEDSDWYTGDVTIQAPEGYYISYKNDLTGTEWKDSVVWNTDGEAGSWPEGSEPVIYLKNRKSGAITDAIPVSDLKRDTEKPTGLAISYDISLWDIIGEKLFGFSASTVNVTVSASDSLSGIGKMEYSKDGGETYTEISAVNGKYEFSVEAQYRGQLWLRATDVAGNPEVYKDRDEEKAKDKILVVDDIAPKVEIAFTGDRQDTVKADSDTEITRETMTEFDATTRFIYNGNVTATIKVTEANFFPDNDDMTVRIKHDGEFVTDFAAAGITDSGWQLADGTYTRTFEMTEDGDYQLFAEYKDRSLNDMEWESKEYAKTGEYNYESNIHTIDTTAPVYEVTYDNNTVIQTLDGREYYATGRTATIKVTDRNFRPSEVVFNVTYTDIAGAEVEYTYSKLTAWSDWTKDGDTWTAVVPFASDANYTVSFSYDDLANGKMVNKNGTEEVYGTEFTVDTKIPAGLNVAYKSKDAQILNKILNAITFGNYKAEQEVVLTMTDATAGIDYIKLTVTPEGPASATDLVMPEDLVVNADGSVRSGTKGFIGTIKSSANNGELTLSFDVPAQFRGKFSFVAYDKSGNNSADHADAGVLVVDTIAPGYTVSYNPSNVVNVSDMKDMADFDAANGIADITSADANYVMYFCADAVAKIEIAEANFDPAQVTIVVQDAKGNAVQGWTQTDWVTTTKDGEADVHTKTVTVAAEGDYQIKVSYQDHSMNTPVEYLSQWIVVDKTAPVIDVQYSNTDVKNTIDDRDYFAGNQTATITIKERNFRADDVVIKVSAKDVLGADVLTLNADGTVKAYADQGADRKSWTAYESGTWRAKDDAYVITLNYTADANYTFDIDYIDLAKNQAADYSAELFTVDATAPKNLEVTYSTSVFQEILQSVTFGYYNATMTVTISAEDDTTGIYHFAYSYIKSQYVSGVNAELLDQAIKEADITYDGKRATATFKIPKLALGYDNQFNGTVQFVAYDRSENSTDLKDTTRIVVDNISPTAKITYNAPVKEANGVSYYAGDIEATIVITEANFRANDVVVTVTKDGQAYKVNTAWHDNSVDTHTGTFTLTEDGDYIVSVQYRDKSGNQMAAYTSNELTLDTKAPSIQVSDIKQNSANKDAKYGFTIEISDIKLDVSSMKPVLKAVIQGEDGQYKVSVIDLGKATEVVAGQTYTYTVENLEADALYSLTCEAEDMSDNANAKMLLDDGKSYELVQFSINRNGSAFGYGNTFTEELVNKYYVYSVDEDLVVVEVNVDPIEEYTVSVNGKELTEGTEYTTEQTSNEGEWSKRTYTIKKDLFASEGEYNVIVSSTDKAETTAFSDVKNLALRFVVDQTEPVLTITGLENGGRYQTDLQKVTIIPTDEGGRLNSLSVQVLNADGNPLADESGNNISELFNMEGEELLKYLEENDGKIVVEIPEGLNSKVRIICDDCAVGAESESNEYNKLFENVTVSTNQLVIFYANKPLFFGTIIGLVAIVIILIILIKNKKDKKEKAKV